MVKQGKVAVGLGLVACTIACGAPLLTSLGVGAALAQLVGERASLLSRILVTGGVALLSLALLRKAWRAVAGAREGLEASCGCAPAASRGRRAGPVARAGGAADGGGAESDAGPPPLSVAAEPGAPIACTLEGSGIRTRVDEFRDLFQRGYLGGDRIEGGVRWRFRDSQDLEREARRLAEREHDCCRFFQFDIHRRDGEIWWETRSAEEARPVLEEFFLMPERLLAGADERAIHAVGRAAFEAAGGAIAPLATIRTPKNSE